MATRDLIACDFGYTPSVGASGLQHKVTGLSVPGDSAVGVLIPILEDILGSDGDQRHRR